MKACEESVALIAQISENIKKKGYYLLADRKIELITQHAPNEQLKMHRLKSFAHLHHWQVEVRHHGHSALFYPPEHPPHEMN
jgi:hypothetical protein